MESLSNDKNQNNRKERKVKAQPSISMETLPYDILVDILSRLSITSLVQCKLVSRLWHSSVTHPLSIAMHLSRATENNPCLVCFSNDLINKLDIVDLSSCDNEILLKCTLNFPSEFNFILPHFDVVGSCNGLFCLHSRPCNHPLFIYNPFTREYKELPQFINSRDLNKSRVIFGFGFHFRTKEYKVIKIACYKERNEAFVLTLGTSEWRYIGQTPSLLSYPVLDVLVNGNLHWLTERYQVEKESRCDIISFDLATEEFQLIPQLSGLGPTKFIMHIVALDNRLAAVVSCRCWEYEIWVLKNSWTREFVIPRYAPQISIIPHRPLRFRLDGSRQRTFRVVCSLKGRYQILLQYQGRCLVAFNQENGKFKEFRIEGLRAQFESIVHVGSLVSVNAAFSGYPSQPDPAS